MLIIFDSGWVVSYMGRCIKEALQVKITPHVGSYNTDQAPPPFPGYE